MDYALGMIAPFAFWCAVVTAVAITPAGVALFTGRKRLGGWLMTATAAPVLLFLGVTFSEASQFAASYSLGEAPRGVMWSMALILPTAWCVFMLLLGAVLVTFATLRGQARRAEQMG